MPSRYNGPVAHPADIAIIDAQSGKQAVAGSASGSAFSSAASAVTRQRAELHYPA